MRRYAEEVRRTHGLAVQIRVGLNSGEVVVRAIGNDLHMDYSAVGQTTHLAARMEQLATPGQHPADRRHPAAGGRAGAGQLPWDPCRSRGWPSPWRSLSWSGPVPSAGACRRRWPAGSPALWGGRRSWRRCTRRWSGPGAGHGQVVALVGEAGVGKSRLVYELVHSHRTQGWLVLESASVSYGKATPYFPVLDLLKRYAQVEDRDDTRTIRAKVTGQVLTLDEALQETIPALLALLDALPEDSPFLHARPAPAAPAHARRRSSACCCAKARCSRCCWSSRICTGSIPRRRPCSTAWSRACRRPGSCSWSTTAPSTSTAGAARPTTRNCGSTRCHPASADEFLQALLGDDPSLAPLKQLLIARTEGNPFFLEESVRTLVETGVLVGERGRLSPGAGRSPSLQVPATVQAVLAARIDRLPPEEKRLLQTAAVIGTEVPLPLLQAIAELPEEALHRGLAHLQAAEFLYETQPLPGAGLHLQARPDARGGLRESPPGAAAGAARPHRRGPRGALPATAWPSRSNGWPTMPCGARCGTRPLAYCRQAGAQGAWRARPTGRRWPASSRRWRPCSISPSSREHA